MIKRIVKSIEKVYLINIVVKGRLEMSNRGGKRTGAGRKPLKNKKQAVPVYFSSDLKKIIQQLEIGNCEKFSQKCIYLIEKGLFSLEQETLDFKGGINYESNINYQKIKFVDLFAGMGGLRLGFEQGLKELGIQGESVFVSEIKKHAISAYRKNFPNEKIYGDITQIDASMIPDFDILLAGFPCQAFSNAGKRLGFEDTRGTLFFDVARILKEKKPTGFILENVEGLVTHDKGKTLLVIMNTLEELNYSVSYKVLDGQDFGLAQSRKRIYIVGTKNTKIDLDNFETHKSVLSEIIEYNEPPEHNEFTEKLLKHYALNELIGKKIKDKRGGKNNIHSWDFELKGSVNVYQKELLEILLKQRRNKKWADVIGIDWMDGMPLTIDQIRTFYDHENLEYMLKDLVKKGYLVYEHPKKKVGNRRIYDETLPRGYNIVSGKLSFKYNQILDPLHITPTLVATDLSKLAVPVENGLRSLTIREGLRLFGYPEYYTLDHLEKSKAYDLLGNTVCVPVVKKISERVLKAIEVNS